MLLALLGVAAFAVAVPARDVVARFIGRGPHLVLVGALGALLAVPFCELLALRLRAVDWPDRRKAPARPTPRMGALAVAAGVAVSVAVAGEIRVTLAVTLAGALAVLGLGLARDAEKASAAWLQAALVLAAAAAVVAGVRLPVLPADLSGAPAVNALLGWAWLVAVAHGLDRLDRADGLAAGATALAAAGLAAAHGPGPASLAVLGACLGFLPANLRPGGAARLYLGRGGAPALGLLLAALAAGGDPARPGTGLVPALLILGLPLYELGRRGAAALARSLAPWRVPERETRALPDALAALLHSDGRAVAIALLLAGVWGACALALAGDGPRLPVVVQAAAALLVLMVLDRAGSRRERRSSR